MMEAIEIVKEPEVGVDIGGGAHAFDISVMGRFTSVEDLDAFMAHPLHAELRPRLIEAMEEWAVVDHAAS
jgi:hypothetical protein